MAPQGSRPHHWTPFEKHVLLCLIVRNIHIHGMPSDEYTHLAASTVFGKPHRNTPKSKISSKDAMKDVCTMLNNICHGGDYENDVPEADIRSMLEKMLSEGKDAVKWQERQGVSRITRTARKVWGRKMAGARGLNRIVRSDGNGGEVIVVAQDVPDEEMTLEDAILADAWAAMDRQREERGDDRGRNIGRDRERISQIGNFNSKARKEDRGRDDRWRKEYASDHHVANNGRQGVIGVQRRVTWDDGGFDAERRKDKDDFQNGGQKNSNINQGSAIKEYRPVATIDFFLPAPTMSYDKYKSAPANGDSTSANNSKEQDMASRISTTNTSTRRRTEYGSGTSKGRNTFEGGPYVSSTIANYDTSTSRRTPSWETPGPYEDPYVQTANKSPTSLSYSFVRPAPYDDAYMANSGTSNTSRNILGRATMKYTGPRKNDPLISGNDENAMQGIEFASSKPSAQIHAVKEKSSSSSLKRGSKIREESGNVTKPNFRESFPDGILISNEEMATGILSSRQTGADKEKSNQSTRSLGKNVNSTNPSTVAKFLNKPSKIGLESLEIANDTRSSKQTRFPSSDSENNIFPPLSHYHSPPTGNNLLGHRTEATDADPLTFNDEGMVDFSSGGGGFQLAHPSSTPAHISLAAPTSSVGFEADMNPARWAMLARNSKAVHGGEEGDEIGERMDWEGDDAHGEEPLRKKRGKENLKAQTNKSDAADGGKKGGRGGNGENAIPLPFNRLARG